MTSVTAGVKQNLNDVGYYIPIASLFNKVYAYNGTALSTATWAYIGSGAPLSSILSAGAGGILKDMGKTVISSSRVFRKVQLVRPIAATFGVAGQVGTTDGEDYLTGYIELGFEGGGTPAPVAHFGR